MRFRQFHRILGLLLAVSSLTIPLGCGGGDSPGSSEGSPTGAGSGAIEEWALSETPILEIGVREGEEPYQLHRARGSVLLEDGRVVVLNAGSQELRYYDEDGEYLSSVGGLGEGPGEFRDPAGLRRTPDGKLQVWDRGLMRVSVFETEGSYESSSTLLASGEEMFPGDDWIRGQSWIVSPVPPGARGPIRKAVDALPPPDSLGKLRALTVTPQGRIWHPNVRPPSDSAVSWEVYDLNGRPVAEITTPARFEPHEIGEDYMTGLFLDDVDINHVRVYEIQKPNGSPPGPGLDLSVSPGRPQEVSPDQESPDQAPSEEVMAGIRSLLKNMASLEEIYYSNHYTYTQDLGALFANSRAGVPDDLAVDILYAGTEAWALTVSHPESGGRCFLGYGRFIPMGWQPGAIVCP